MNIEEALRKLDVTMGAAAKELDEMIQSDNFKPEEAFKSIAQCNLAFFDWMIGQIVVEHYSPDFAGFVARGVSANIVKGFNDRLDNPEKYYDAPGSVNVIDTK